MLGKDMIKKEMRLDDREHHQIRHVSIEKSPNLLCVRSGQTEKDSCVLLSHSKTIAKPVIDKPAEGIFQINLEKGKKNDILLNLLHKTFILSKCVDMTDLSIRFNQSCYMINIEIFLLQSDGDLFRLCVQGINTILKDLNVKTYYLPVAYHFTGLGNTIISDPTEYELLSCEWQSYIVMKSTREFLLVEKTGEVITVECFRQIVERAMHDILNVDLLL